MLHSLLILALAAAPAAFAQDPPAPAWPAGSVFDDRPAAAAAPRTTPEAADHACRGQLYRRPGETRAACAARLVEADALSAALPQGEAPRAPRCRRESHAGEDGRSFRLSVVCEDRTVTTTSPR